MVHTCLESTWEVEAWGSELEHHPAQSQGQQRYIQDCLLSFFLSVLFVLFLLLLLFKSYSPIPFSGLKTTVAPCGLRAKPKSMHAIQSNFQACLILPLQKCTFLLPQRPHGQAGLFITRLCSLPLVSPSQHPPVARAKAFVGHSALPRSFLLSSRQSTCFMQSLVIARVVDYPSLSLFFPKTMAPWRTRL